MGLLLLALTSAPVLVAQLDGVISPASSGYIVRAIEEAERRQAVCLILNLDTPGGLDESMRTITKKILNARIPVVVYVAPRGARAASAGTFILYAAHVAAMAPGTTVGAAHPVSMGGEKMDSVMAKKVANDAVAYIHSLAQDRHRNADWAEKAVRESASIDAETALRNGVCEIIADDLNDLRRQLQGRTVVVNGDSIALDVAGAETQPIAMTLRDKLLLILTNPNIAYILLLLGFYGLFFELQNPGMVLPGVVGGISLILAFYSLHVLPVNYAGVALIFLSAVLFIVDVFATAHGILTAGGIVALVTGSLILFESNVPYLRVSLEVIMAVVILTVLLVVILLALGVRAQFRRPVTGQEGMVGEEGVAKTAISPSGGTVFVHGEFWNAQSEKPINKDCRIKVTAAEGTVLKVQAV